MYVQIDPKTIEAYLKKGGCVQRKLKLNLKTRKRKRNARQQYSNKYN
jgi:hypothetical protein